MAQMTPGRCLGTVALLCALAFAIGCRPIENHEELQSLAGEVPAEVAEPPAGSPSGAGDETLDSFRLTGSVFPGLGGRLHSSLCDPASDPYSTCL